MDTVDRPDTCRSHNVTWFRHPHDFTHYRLADGRDVVIRNFLDDHSRLPAGCVAYPESPARRWSPCSIRPSPATASGGDLRGRSACRSPALQRGPGRAARGQWAMGSCPIRAESRPRRPMHAAAAGRPAPPRGPTRCRRPGTAAATTGCLRRGRRRRRRSRRRTRSPGRRRPDRRRARARPPGAGGEEPAGRPEQDLDHAGPEDHAVPDGHVSGSIRTNEAGSAKWLTPANTIATAMAQRAASRCRPCRSTR